MVRVFRFAGRVRCCRRLERDRAARLRCRDSDRTHDPRLGVGNMVSLNTPVMGALKPTVYGIGTWGVPVAVIVHVPSLRQLAR